MALVDVVVVSYNSRARLRGCVEALARDPDVAVIVADNASADGSLDSIADLPVRRLELPRNGGFAHGCNAGFRAGSSPYALFLNPDARIDGTSLRRLVRVLDEDPGAGAAAPRIRRAGGGFERSQRRFPRLRSTYAQALFLHRLFPRAQWADEVVRADEAYDAPARPDWVSGACILVRRTLLEQLGGWDERFFLYCEDIDLCRRIWNAGFSVRYEPGAECVHEGGASAPPSRVLPVLAVSRVRYARKHRGRVAALAERGGIALGALTHALLSGRGASVRQGNALALRALVSRAGS